MSKSDQKKNSCIWITDSPEEVEEKVQKAFTDSFGTIEFEPATRPGISNLVSFEIYFFKYI
jgi:tryptophanyl-tRNA synthetase